MNPPNIFGRQQGAFQAPSNTTQSSGLFQSFGQQGTSSATPNVGFGQTSTFGQISAFGQQPVFGQGSGQASVFGQTSSFGQTPSFGQSGGVGQSSSFSSITQTPAFGQPALGQATLGFGTPPSSTGQSQQTPAFPQVPAFGQGPPFNQSSGLGQPTPAFGVSANNSQMSTSSIGTGLTQPKFGLPFNQQSAFSLPPSSSGSAMSVQNRTEVGGIVTKFRFNPPNESVFKPIFSVSPEPSNPKTAPDAFGLPKPTDSSGTGMSGGSLFSSVKPASLGFVFSQPGAAPSLSGTSANTSKTEAFGGNACNFTFSQPANPSNSNDPTAAKSTTIPSNSSSFNFAPKVLQPQTEAKAPLFDAAAFGQPQESSGDTGFVNYAKGTKRKEESGEPAPNQGNSSKSEDTPGEAGAPRHPPKRPLLTTRAFQNALSALKPSVKVVKKEDSAAERTPECRSDPPVSAAEVPVAPNRPQGQMRHFLEKAEKPAPVPEAKPAAIARRDRLSSDSLSEFSAAEATAIQCKGVPPNINRKELVEKHFGQFGKVRRLYCKPEKNLVIVHYNDHASAAKAKKRGKNFQGSEIQIFWQRKKLSPGEKKKPSEVLNKEELRTPVPLLTPLLKLCPRSPASGASSSLTKGSPAIQSSVAKTLQFDNDNQQEMGTEGQNMERPVITLPSSLQPLIGQIAETAEEKYRLLEQRDKILRQLRPKRTLLDLSKVFVGTCPDMCPEKERYMRETRNQLSIFELIPDTEKVDHCAAVKEYSRSSADQEEPLPHELRPLPVLSMTMDYLVTQILDQGDGNYRDWYDFVWNRTRGIRKDITQQHLCDPKTVSLIEKCTRFHIHCAHHLCQEPMMSFDAKINNENMTKCLQSLKEMYQDLATKEVFCPHEAEFRQYSVLLKLNDGDILREVQQFRKEVRDSPEVKFAVQAFAALNSNNFVRFFKLVKAATYLAACILHRYFNQVRRAALKAINVACTVSSQRPTAFPIEDMVRMLMFRNASEALDFLQQYGLSVTDGIIELSRIAYQEPDLPLPQKKSVVIEMKRAVLIGEVVNGEPLPNPPQYRPVCSFDSNNKYIGDTASIEPPPSAAVKAVPLPQRQDVKLLDETHPRSQLRPTLLAVSENEAQSKDTAETGETFQQMVPVLPINPQVTFKPIFQPPPVRPPSPPPKPEPAYSDQDLMAVVETVVEDILDAEVLGIAKAGAEYVSAALSVSESELEVVLSNVVPQMLREMCASEVTAERERIAEEKRKQEEARWRQEYEAFLDKLSSELCAEISEEVLAQCSRETAQDEIKLALSEKAACLARCTEEVCNDLMGETLDVEIAQIAKEMMDVELRRIHKFIKRWRDVVAVRRQLKRQMRSFPAAPCCVDPRFKLKALAPSAPSVPSVDNLSKGFINLGNSGNMVVSCTRLLKTRNENFHQMRVDFYYNLLMSERVWTPLDLPTLVAKGTPDPPDRIFWKAALLLPSSQDNDMSFANSTLTKWLKVKLGGGERMEESMSEMEGKLETLYVSNSLRCIGQKTHKVHLCMKVSHGPLSEEGQNQIEKRKGLLGTSALIMLVPPLISLEQGEEDVPLLSALLQLKQVQQASGWNTALPLALIIPGQLEGAFTEQKLEEVLMLTTLLEDGLISEYIFVHVSGSISDLHGSQQIGEALQWLVARSPASSVLTSQPLLQFVESRLCSEFYSRFLHDKQERVQAGLSCQEPGDIIQLYNSVLEYLSDVVSSEMLSNLSWPPPEFSLPESREIVPQLEWNSPQHLAWLKRAILSLQIPKWVEPPHNASWQCLCTFIFQYVSQIPSSSLSQPILMSRLDHLLARVRAQHLQPATEDDEEIAGPSYKNMPWDDILFLCIEHRMKDWHLPEGTLAKDAFTDSGEILVYYCKAWIQDFLPPESWVEAVKRTHREKQQASEGSNVNSRLTKTPEARPHRQKLFQSHMETVKSPPVLDITHTHTAQETLDHRLLSSIEKEKAESQRFTEQLQRLLEVDPLDMVSMPLFVPSTLLSVPELLAPTLCPRTSSSCRKQENRTDDRTRRAPSTSLSLAQRLDDLDRMILANREEERACNLKLKSLVEIIED